MSRRSKDKPDLPDMLGSPDMPDMLGSSVHGPGDPFEPNPISVRNCDCTHLFRFAIGFLYMSSLGSLPTMGGSAEDASADDSTTSDPYRTPESGSLGHLSMSDAETETPAEFPYRALSGAAVVSLLLALVALTGLIFYPGLAFAAVGIACAFWALATIRKYPEEYGGRNLAVAGLMVNAMLLFGGAGYHIYDYVTEVPDGYVRVNYWELQPPDGAADAPTPRAFEVNGQDVFLKGYVHPTSGAGMLRQFILVPDLGTCCFGGQPKSTDMVSVVLDDGQTVKTDWYQKKLAGKFLVSPRGMRIAGFDNGIFYRFNVDQVDQ